MFRSRPAQKVRAYRPRLEVLEDRALLSTYLVDHLADDGAGTGLNGSLRYAISHAVDGDAINFGVTGTINLNNVLPDLAHNISINGPGANLLTVRGAGSEGRYPFRVFTVPAGATVSISGLTITNGYSTGGGGIANAGTLTLSNSTVTGNAAYYEGTFDFPAYAPGGGIYNGNNSGTAVLTIINSTISGNWAGGDGGGIANGFSNYITGYGEGPGGTVTVSNSTVSGNYCECYGGGIENVEGSLTVINSTIVNNGLWSVDGSGGGIDDGAVRDAGRFDDSLTVTNSTIAGNRASYCGGIAGGDTLNIRNSIIAGNSARYGGPDLCGALTSSGYNLIGDGSGDTGFDATDLVGTDSVPINPQLGPLQNNGGPTQTMALLAGSPALNAGDPAQLGVADQRGVARRGGVNIGAYQASASAFVLTAPATATAGTPFDLTVKAVDPFGQTALGYTGTVTFSTTDPDPRVILPADYVFMAADQGQHTFSGGATLYTTGGQTIRVTDTLDKTLTGSVTVTL
jgi:hypothetical protein